VVFPGTTFLAGLSGEALWQPGIVWVQAAAAEKACSNDHGRAAEGAAERANCRISESGGAHKSFSCRQTTSNFCRSARAVSLAGKLAVVGLGHIF